MLAGVLPGVEYGVHHRAWLKKGPLTPSVHGEPHTRLRGGAVVIGRQIDHALVRVVEQHIHETTFSALMSPAEYTTTATKTTSEKYLNLNM